MADLVLGGVGAAVGWFVGGPTGAKVGWALGSAAGSYLFTDTHEQEGPRLEDLSVSTAAYGEPIPVGFGSFRTAGNRIWATELREESDTTTQGGKGGGDEVEVTEYSYYASFAIGLAAGPIEGVTRIWADGKLIHDRTGGSVDQSFDGRLQFRVYPGDEEQMPDPLIEAHEGEGNVPAFRGLGYIVFEDLPLNSFGRRVPMITCEVVFKSDSACPALKGESLPDAEFTSSTHSQANVDWRNNMLILRSRDGLRRFNLRTLKEEFQATNEEILSDPAVLDGSGIDEDTSPNHPIFGPDGYLYSLFGAGNTNPLMKIDPDSLTAVDRFGSRAISLSINSGGFTISTAFGFIQAFSAEDQGWSTILLGSGRWDTPVIGAIDADSMQWIGRFDSGETEATQCRQIIQGKRDQSGDAWILRSGGANNTHETRLPIERMTAHMEMGPLGISYRLEFTGKWALSPDDVGAVKFTREPNRGVYDPIDDAIVFLVGLEFGDPEKNPEGLYAVKFGGDSGVLWVSERLFSSSGGLRRYDVNHAVATTRTEGRFMAWKHGDWVVKIDLRSGRVVTKTDCWPSGGAVYSYHAMSYDPASDSIAGWGGPDYGFASRFLLDRASGKGTTPAEIVEGLCERAGITDVDVSEIHDPEVRGYAITRQTPLRNGIEPVMEAFNFDAVESDGTLVFRPRARGGDEATVLTDKDLVPLSDSGDAVKIERVQEVDLPASVTMKFQDQESDYQEAAQQVRRVAQPNPSMEARSSVTHNLPLALHPDQGRQAADRALTAAWTEREGFEFRLPARFLAYDPTDLVRLPMPGGEYALARITEAEVGANWEIRCTASRHVPEAYSSEVTADLGGARVGRVEADVPGRYAIPEAPLLRDEDEAGEALTTRYLFASPASDGKWRSLALMRARDGVDWDRAAHTSSPAVMGSLRSGIGAPPSPWVWDRETVIEVRAYDPDGQVQSRTERQVLDGRNAALIVDADGDCEVIQYRDAEEIGAGIVRLSHLLRGRRGTEHNLKHRAGAKVVLMPDAGTMWHEPVDMVGRQIRYRGVGRGQSLEDVDTRARTITGADKKPYAPVHIAGDWTMDGINITWVRRTRTGGAWRDGTGTVPLAERSERYEVDILDGDGEVLRTLESDEPSALYPRSHAIEDFESVPDSVDVRVYQISETVGRGRAAKATLLADGSPPTNIELPVMEKVQ
ncbi:MULTISPECIES: phage tail protein [unclassified Thioalkalivibrio]|uniref:phage tail protein n=1 Tax=unclassified Thioalkalivibrio TaxID=2621013 RepID=UPI00036693B3|nr:MULTISPECIES: phage tail protein [unclassified Thioalkalivibrio]